MLNIFKSTDPNTLVDYFAARLSAATGGIFADHRLIVPSMTISDWLVNKLADRLGICAQIRPMFWGEFAWKLAEDITGDAEIGGYAPLSAATMQWQLFSDFCARENTATSFDDPVAMLLSAMPNDAGGDHLKKYRLVSEQLANIFVRYLSLRPHWLWQWSCGQGNEIKDMLADLRRWQDLPSWTRDQLEIVVKAQRHLWQQHFARPFLRRCLRQEMFWRILEANCPKANLDKPFFGQRLTQETLDQLLQNPALGHYWQHLSQNSLRRQAALPDHIFVYGIEGVTKDQWHFLADLGRFCEIDVFHQVMTSAYLLDIIDEKLLKRQELAGVEKFFDSAHPIFSRLGKQQKSTARLLAESEDFITTHEIDFIRFYDDQDEERQPPQTLLNTLQTELQELNPELIAALKPVDNSIEIHGCHGLMRQLEILRGELAHSLNRNPQLELSDILIVMPEVAKYQAVIRAIFPPLGNYDGYYLPARITGLTPPAAQNLWEALSGIYRLAKSRFDCHSVCDWLLSDDVCMMLGVSHEAMERITEALLAAGFRRGFDESTLPADDHDERFTFCYALDRLCAGLLLPDCPCYAGKIIPQSGLSLDDVGAINALCRLANRWRELLQEEPFLPIEDWLKMLQEQLIKDFEHATGSTAYSTVSRALADLVGQLEALARESDQQTPKVPLSFVLDDISKHLAAQQSSSEPSGVITIGRLGAMRGLPYKLIAFVNFNMDEFPGLRQDDRYDLITLDREQAGDRTREHEDLGALLESICNAREKVLFFYNRFRDDGEEQLPSSPLQELLQYLSEKMGYFGEADNPLHILQQSDPFHPDQSRSRPAPLWHKVALALSKTAEKPKPFVIPSPPDELPPIPTPEKQTPLKFSYFIRGLQNPAERYLKAQEIQIKQEKNTPASFEPLILDALENYTLDQYLIDHISPRDFDPLPLLPLYPVGLGGKIYLQSQREKITDRQRKLLALTNSQCLPQLSEQLVSVAGIHITILLPVEAKAPWLQLSASKVKDKYILKQWIAHLLRHLAGGAGESICAYNDKIITFAALDHQKAQSLFLPWLKLWYYSGTAFWALPVKIPFQCQDGHFRPVVDKWLKELERNDFDENKPWLFLLKNQENPADLITCFADQYADFLYQPIFAHLSEENF